MLNDDCASLLVNFVGANARAHNTTYYVQMYARVHDSYANVLACLMKTYNIYKWNDNNNKNNNITYTYIPIALPARLT